MFLLRRPSAPAIERFLERSHGLPLSYSSIGLVRQSPVDPRFDEQVVSMGHGPADFARAQSALTWKHFDIGRVETFPRHASVETGTVVAVLTRAAASQ